MLWVTLLTSPIQNVFLGKLNHIFCRDYLCFHLLPLSSFFFCNFYGKYMEIMSKWWVDLWSTTKFHPFQESELREHFESKKKEGHYSSAKGHYKPSVFIYLCMYLFIYLLVYTLFTKFVDHHLNTYD